MSSDGDVVMEGDSARPNNDASASEVAPLPGSPPTLPVAPGSLTAANSASASASDCDDADEAASNNANNAANNMGGASSSSGDRPSLLSLSWQDFPHSVSRALRLLQEEEEFVDVTLACGHSRQFSAHKVILSACSPYFRKLLKVRRNNGE